MRRLWMMPRPVGCGDVTISSGTEISSAADAPTTSTIASIAPASCRCTFSSVDPVHARFRFGQHPERVEGSTFHSHVEGGPFDDGSDVRVAAGSRLRCDLDRSLCVARSPDRVGRLEARAPSRGGPSASSARRHLFLRRSHVDERAQDHVAGRSGETVEVEDSHRLDPSEDPHGATPAPNPLSMFVTVTPAAQRVQHPEQSGEPVERGAVPDARRNRDDRARKRCRRRGWQRTLHPGDDDHDVCGMELVLGLEQSVDAGHADVVIRARPRPRELRRYGGFLGDRQVGGTGRDDGDRSELTCGAGSAGRRGGPARDGRPRECSATNAACSFR